MEGNFRMEDFILDKELGKPANIKEITLKESERIPDWVYMEMIDT